MSARITESRYHLNIEHTRGPFAVQFIDFGSHLSMRTGAGSITLTPDDCRTVAEYLTRAAVRLEAQQ